MTAPLLENLIPGEDFCLDCKELYREVCGGVRRRGPRHLCARCYDRNRRDGTLEDFPRRTWPVEVLVANATELLRMGISKQDIAARMGVTWDSITLARRRLQRRGRRCNQISCYEDPCRESLGSSTKDCRTGGRSTSMWINVGAKHDTGDEVVRIPTKTALRKLVKEHPGDVRFDNTSAFAEQADQQAEYRASELPEGVRFTVCGPDPYTARNWFATVTLVNGQPRVIS